MFSDPIGQSICQMLADGMSLRQACRMFGLAESTVRSWALADPLGRAATDAASFPAQYASARAVGYERLADEIVDISDGKLPATFTLDGGGTTMTALPDPQRDRLRVDSRKWMLAKMLPKVYGERVVAEVTGKDGAPLFPAAQLTDDQLAAIAAGAPKGDA